MAEERGYRVIDTAGWKRAAHCEKYRGWAQPYMSVTFELDITAFLKHVKARGIPFTFAMIYAVCTTANDLEAFRYRFLNGQVVLFDRADTLFTYLDGEGELFKMVKVPLCGSVEEYAALAARSAAAQEAHFTDEPDCGVMRCTSLPWISFTNMSSAFSGDPDYATPIFAWGKYTEKNGRYMIPFTVQAHHSFVDGVHIGRLAQALQNRLDSFD